MSDATSTASRSKTRIRLLGVPSIEYDGAGVSVARRPLCVVLLAMIVMAEPDRRLSRKSIAAALWPEDDESSASANLRRHLSYLIEAFPDAERFVGRDRETLWCRAADAPWCDVVAFERGELDLYTSEFMEGVTHEWVSEQRERLRTMAVDALLRRAEALRDDDDYERAIECARRASRIDPSNESAAHLEMEFHGERGDIAALDRTFGDLQRRLRDIDAVPAPEVVALFNRFHSLARDAAARIPRPLTSFVETDDLENLIELAHRHRLVTIEGPGGVGKTRLALEAAYRLAPGFPDGAYFADLSTVVEGDALANALSRALGASSDLASKGFSGIHTLLRNRRALLVLDNCEQIAESCSWFLNELLKAAPHVRVIATTREAFGLSAEHCYALKPLSLAQAERLFVERAKSAAWNAGHLPPVDARVASICKRLDCLPLALELAASMLGALPLSDVERQLEDGFERLRSRDRTTPPRHRSLSDVIAWSVSLFDDGERDAFTKLGVFTGAFSADAAKAVCAVDTKSLAKLVTASVLSRPDAVESRFGFLNVIGDDAKRRLDDDPRCRELRNAHAAWYAGIAMRAEEPGFWPVESAWLDEVARDFPNFLRALEWSLYGDGLRTHGMRLAMGLTQYFVRRGFYAEGAAWLGAALDVTEEPVQRARLMSRLARIETVRCRFEPMYALVVAARRIFEEAGLDEELAFVMIQEGAALLFLGRTEESKELLERTLPLAQRIGQPRMLARLNANLAHIYSATDPAASQAFELQALRYFTECGDESNVAHALNTIAGFEYVAGRYDAAIEGLERALAIHRTFGDLASIAGCVTDLGDVALIRGRPELAYRHYAEALSIIEMHGEVPAFPFLFSGIAGLAVHARRPREAARLLGAARWRESIVAPARVRVRNHVRALLEEHLDKNEWALEMALGQQLPFKDATRLAREVLNAPTVD